MDGILKTAMKDRAGIEWIDGEKLSDLDFADNIALLEDSWEGMHTTTSALEEAAKKSGLVNNVAETKVMTVGNWKSTGKIKIGSKQIEKCQEFSYLDSTITNDGVCDNEILVRLGKANSTGGWTVGENLGEPEDIHLCKGPAV